MVEEKRVSQAEFARIIGASPVWVMKLCEQGMPSTKTGKRGAGSTSIPTAAAIKWMIEREKRKHGGTSVEDATLRLKAAKAAIAEIDADERRGEMRLLSDYQQATSEAAVIFASQMEGLPSRMASQLSTMSEPGQIRKALADETRRIRQAVSDRLRDWAVLETGGSPDSAAAGENSRSVGRRKQNTASRDA